MRIGRLNRDKAAALFVWVYVIEATTFYVKSNFIDNVFQMGCILLMIFLLFATNNVSRLTFDSFFLMYILLLLIGWIPDLFSGYATIGMTVMASYALPLLMYLYVKNRFSYIKTNVRWLIKVPVVYGVIISVMGIIQEIANFLGLPINIWLENIGKTGNSNVALCSLFGLPLGAYSSWGSLAGKTLLRIQGFYIEPSKMAMFLMIPIFFSWGLYKRTNRKTYKIALVLCIICFVLTMSRAGIVSIVAGLVVKRFYIKKANKNSVKRTTPNDIMKLIGLAFGIVIAAVIILLLMVQLSKFFPSLEFLYAGITNLTTGKANLIRTETVDIPVILNGLASRPWGFGFSNNLHGSTTSVLDTNLANALILWLVTGGILGAIIAGIIILTILIKYGIPCLKSNDPIHSAVGLSFVCLAVHSLSYGTWMTPEFILVVSIMVVIRDKYLYWDQENENGWI